jgi:hypothetical protein
MLLAIAKLLVGGLIDDLHAYMYSKQNKDVSRTASTVRPIQIIRNFIVPN